MLLGHSDRAVATYVKQIQVDNLLPSFANISSPPWLAKNTATNRFLMICHACDKI
jgi:hypothetical protein